MQDYPFNWQSYAPFFATTSTQQLLKKCYEEIHCPVADQKSFENCYPFLYYLEHGQNYYELAEKAPIAIKPMLLFYGMVQLIKACLLTVDAEYPQSTTVLAHGVSTRKRKKQNYEFIHDEVKVQKNGLFVHFSQNLFHVKQLDGEKYTMGELLKRIPELNTVFYYLNKKPTHIKLHSHSQNTKHLCESILDHYHITVDRLTSLLSSSPFTVKGVESKKIHLAIKEELTINPLACSPVSYHFYEQEYYFPTDKSHLTPFPEIMVHYLLLYNLSMISRYETEWWSELLRSYASSDYPFINQFLKLTSEKVPFLLLQFLRQKAHIE